MPPRTRPVPSSAVLDAARHIARTKERLVAEYTARLLHPVAPVGLELCVLPKSDGRSVVLPLAQAQTVRVSCRLVVAFAIADGTPEVWGYVSHDRLRMLYATAAVTAPAADAPGIRIVVSDCAKMPPPSLCLPTELFVRIAVPLWLYTERSLERIGAWLQDPANFPDARRTMADIPRLLMRRFQAYDGHREALERGMDAGDVASYYLTAAAAAGNLPEWERAERRLATARVKHMRVEDVVAILRTARVVTRVLRAREATGALADLLRQHDALVSAWYVVDRWESIPSLLRGGGRFRILLWRGTAYLTLEQCRLALRDAWHDRIRFHATQTQTHGTADRQIRALHRGIRAKLVRDAVSTTGVRARLGDLQTVITRSPACIHELHRRATDTSARVSFHLHNLHRYVYATYLFHAVHGLQPHEVWEYWSPKMRAVVYPDPARFKNEERAHRSLLKWIYTRVGGPRAAVGVYGCRYMMDRGLCPLATRTRSVEDTLAACHAPSARATDRTPLHVTLNICYA